MPRRTSARAGPPVNFLELEPRRHQRWYERILLNAWLGYVVAFLAVVFTPYYLSYGRWAPVDYNQLLTQCILAACFLGVFALARSLSQYPGGNLLSYRLAITVLVITGALVLITALRLEYSRLPLFIGFFILTVCQILAYVLKQAFCYTKFGVLPGINIDKEEVRYGNALFLALETPRENRRFDALVADMSVTHDDDWVRFIAWYNARRIPVLDGKYLRESISGSVNLEQLELSDVQSLQPDAFYLLTKRALDIVGVVLLLPVAMPLMFIIAIAIRIESPGPVLFIQERIGSGNKSFRMLKFRSMKLHEALSQVPRFADEDEHRITHLGQFLRHMRLDELPQLWNVLTGKMSLIGPRPEQPGFAKKFDKQVPYYSFRHILKPGITGWAQVQQGYVAGLEDTHTKVEHDFYYIKHLSFGLDTLILMKTVRTILTGFGAR